MTGSASVTAQQTFLITVNTDGEQRTDLATIKVTALKSNQFIVDQETVIAVLRAFITLSGQSTDGTVVIDAVDHHIEPLPQGAPPIFS
jgi:hypothetical protein